MSDTTFDTVRRVLAAAEPMWRDAAVDQLARDIVHALPAKVAPTDDAVERAARAWSDHPLIRDGYEPMSDQGWRDYWNSPVSESLRARTAAMLAAARAGEAG